MLYYGLNTERTPPPPPDQFAASALTEKILALSDIAVILTISKSNIVHCSRSVEPILGVSASEVISGGWQTVFDRIHPDDQKLLTQKIHPELRRQLRNLTPEAQLACSFNYTFRVRNGDNQYTMVALDNQRLQASECKSSWPYMSVLKNIAPYGSKYRATLRISKKGRESGWETFFEKHYPVKADGFTARETQIMNLVADGLSSREIGDRLFISAETVRVHRKKLLQKAGCTSTAGLVARALREKIL